MKRFTLVCSISIAILGFHACASLNDVPICSPKTVEGCICDRGLAGQRTCESDGQAFGACTCVADAPQDAAVDATDASSTIPIQP
jgi:hypothetical protein